MNVLSIERRLAKIEAARHRADPALKALSDDELVDALRDVSDDPSDHALADWFQAGCDGPLPAGALGALQRSF